MIILLADLHNSDKSMYNLVMISLLHNVDYAKISSLAF